MEDRTVIGQDVSLVRVLGFTRSLLKLALGNKDSPSEDAMPGLHISSNVFFIDALREVIVVLEWELAIEID